jgi:hypothetical protein
MDVNAVVVLIMLVVTPTTATIAVINIAATKILLVLLSKFIQDVTEIYII